MSDTGSVKSARVPRAQIHSLAGHLVWVGISALLLLLVFPEPGWGFLSHIALVPMMVLAVRSGSWRRIVLAGWGWSVVWWIITIRWMFPVTGVGTIVLAFYLALYWPFAMLCVRYLDRKYHPAMTLSLPMVWTSLEFLRGYLIAGGFGWYALSHSQAGWRPDHHLSRIVQVADIFGEHGVTFLVCMTNGLIVDLLTRPWSKRDASGRPRVQRTIRAATLCWLAAMIGAFLYGEFRIRQLPAVQQPGPMVAVVQTNVPQSNKMTRDQSIVGRDFEALLQLTREAADAEDHVDLIVWPETVTPVPINPEFVETQQERFDLWSRELAEHEEQVRANPDASTQEAASYAEREAYIMENLGSAQELLAPVDRIRGIAVETGVPLLAGSSRIVFTEDAYEQYNAVFLIGNDGVIHEPHYDKMHRVPFGEFVPYVEDVPMLKKLFIKYLTPYDHDYTLRPGKDETVFRVPFVEAIVDESTSEPQPLRVRVATPICFEDTVPRHIRRLTYGQGGKRVDLLANVTNDGWFAGYWQSRAHLQVATFRCVENRVPMVRSVNTGVSATINSNGRVLSIVEGQDGRLEAAGVLVQLVPLDARRTIFGRIGHIPVVLLMILTGILLLMGRFRRDK